MDIDDDLFAAVKRMAETRDISLGSAISELARRGLVTSSRIEVNADGFPTVKVFAGAAPITPEDVQRAEDEI